MPKINKTISPFLTSVPEDKKFWCNDGKVFNNLEELEKGLKKMDESTFEYHVNSEKNDFSNWIYDVIGDVELANELRSIISKNLMKKKISDRIKELKA